MNADLDLALTEDDVAELHVWRMAEWLAQTRHALVQNLIAAAKKMDPVRRKRFGRPELELDMAENTTRTNVVSLNADDYVYIGYIKRQFEEVYFSIPCL